MPIDYKRYPPNWKSELVPAVIKRAENKCEWCGLENKQVVYAIKMDVRDPNNGRYKSRSLWFRDERDAYRESGVAAYEFVDRMESERIIKQAIKPVKVCLTIAHLDHDELNHQVEIDRLRALCQLCHLRYDATEKYRRVNDKHKTLFTDEDTRTSSC